MARLPSHVPTPYASVVRLLQVAGAGPDDVLVDLGSGDGTIANLAALVFGVKKAWGVELDPEKVERSREVSRAMALGEDRVEFICGDMLELDLRGFDVVTVFQSQEAIEMLLGRLTTDLVAGARVVSYLLPLGTMSPLRMVRPSKVSHPFYLYQAPLECMGARESAELLGEISKFAEGSEKEWTLVSAALAR
jgi:hypothetical protein